MIQTFCTFDKSIPMSVDELKKELVSCIESINDENLLRALKTDLMFYSKTTDTDITDYLSEEQFNELQGVVEEDESKDIQTLAEFKKATDKWRTK